MIAIVCLKLGLTSMGYVFTTNSAINKFDYIIFSQDTFVANQRFDLISKDQQYSNAPFNHLSGWCDMKDDAIVHRVLSKFDLYDAYDGVNFTLCWCNSFVLDSKRVIISMKW